jgi:oxygen-independent coproporphyrinogen-3 oxidase
MAGIYLHIPFCKQACHYCDFHFSTNQNNKDHVLKSLATELELQRNYLNATEVKTIYFGGGTPSLLSGSELEHLLDVVRKNFDVLSDAEITLEANPDDLTRQRLLELKNSGINRLSIGIQSFDDTVLKYLNRAHNVALVMKSFHDAREIGFQNISIDLIYAIPDQDQHTWQRNIDQAIALDPEHVSAYSLTIEPKTVFGKWSAQQKIKEVEDDVAAQQLLTLISSLERVGYDHYEVSNFSKPGFISNHNSSYWKAEKYLGIGPSAHSYNGHSRQHNISNNYDYAKAIEANTIPATVEYLTREDKINDFLLTTLRTSWGSDLNFLRDVLQYDILQSHGIYIQDLVKNRFATVDKNILALTRSGRLLADKIASDLFVLPL